MPRNKKLRDPLPKSFKTVEELDALVNRILRDSLRRPA